MERATLQVRSKPVGWSRKTSILVEPETTHDATLQPFLFPSTVTQISVIIIQKKNSPRSEGKLILIYFPNFTTIYTFTLEDLWPKYTWIYYYVQHQICFYITPRQWKPGGWSWTREMGDQVDAHDGAERPLAAARPGAV
jgi:hypothetical protein